MFTAILIIFTILFCVLAWLNLRAAAFFILAALPTYLIRFTIGPIPFTILEIMVVIVILVWLIRYRKQKKPVKDFLIPIFILFIASTIAIFVPEDTVGALGIWKAYFLEPIIFFFVLYSIINTQRDANRAVLALGVGMLFVSAFAVFQKATGLAIPEPWDVTRRVTSFFPYPNAVGLYVAPLVILAFAALARSLRRIHFFSVYFWIITLTLAILAVIFSQTEAVWIAIPATLWIISLFSAWTRWWTLPLGIIAIIVILAVPAIRGPVIEKVTLNDYSGNIRQSQWIETANFLSAHPLLGAGLSGYPTAIEPYHEAKHIEIFQYPHNIILNTWVELGLLGLMALAAFGVEVIRLTRRGFRNPSAPRWLLLGSLGALLVMLIHGLVDVPYLKNDLAIMTWSILALLSFSTRVNET